MRYPSHRALANPHFSIALPRGCCLQPCRCCRPAIVVSAQPSSPQMAAATGPSLATISPAEQSQSSPPWASDISCSTLTAALGMQVTSFQLTEPRELEQSEVCRLRVSSNASEPPTELSLLMKRYHLKRLMARISKPESKWRVTATSFINEFEFHRADRVLQRLGAFLAPAGGLPRVYHAYGRCSDTDWFDRQYDFLFEMLSPEQFYQSNQLNLQEATATVKLLARFHAFFWHSKQPATQHNQDADSQAQSEQQWAGLYPRGAWWRPQLRPSVKFEQGPRVFTHLCAAFPEPHLFKPLDTPEHHQAMQRISDSVQELSAALTDAADRTLVHGDPKTSNLFFNIPTAQDTPASSNTPPAGPLTAFAIDYQWTGRAPSGMPDLVYCLYGGVKYEVLMSHEHDLIEEYVQELWTALKERGMDPQVEASRAWLQAHLAAETVAYVMTAVPQLLDGLTHQVCDENCGKYGWLTHEMDPRCTAVMCSRAITAMQRIDQAGGPKQILGVP